MKSIRKHVDPSVIRIATDSETWSSSSSFEIGLRYDQAVSAKDVSDELVRFSGAWRNAPVFDYVDGDVGFPVAILAWSGAWKSVVGFQVYVREAKDVTWVCLRIPRRFFEAIAGSWRGAGDRTPPSETCASFHRDMIRLFGLFRPELRPSLAAFAPEERRWASHSDAHGVIVESKIALACRLPSEPLEYDYVLAKWRDVACMSPEPAKSEVNETVALNALWPGGAIASVTLEIRQDPKASSWELVVKDLRLGEHRVVGEDLFHAFVQLRRVLEQSNVQLLCAGARPDVYPSGMSLDMGGGRRAYITRMGEAAQSSDLVDIFDNADPESVGSVKQQADFHEKWVESMRRRR